MESCHLPSPPRPGVTVGCSDAPTEPSVHVRWCAGPERRQTERQSEEVERREAAAHWNLPALVGTPQPLNCPRSRPGNAASTSCLGSTLCGVSSDTDHCNYTSGGGNKIKQQQNNNTQCELRAVAGLRLPQKPMSLVPSRWTRTSARAPTHPRALDLRLSSPALGGDRQLYELMQALEVAAQRLSGATHRAQRDLIVHLLRLHLLGSLRPFAPGGEPPVTFTVVTQR